MSEKNSKARGWLIFFIIFSVLLAIVCGYIVAKYNESQENLQLETEAKNQLVTEKNQLIQRLNNVQASYDSLGVVHADLQTDFDARISEIENLKDEIRRWKGTASKYKSQVDAFETERDQYLAQIDDLKARNDSLGRMNTALQGRIDSVFNVSSGLEDIIERNAVLKVYSLHAETFKVKNNGDEKATDKARKTDKFKTCFVVGQNKLISPSSRTIYLRIEDPAKKVLNGDKNTDAFVYNGSELQYTLKQNLYYNGESANLCLNWTKDEDANLEDGNYYIQLFIDDKQVGVTSLTLD